jgi:hypothetical protein
VHSGEPPVIHRRSIGAACIPDFVTDVTICACLTAGNDNN